MILAELPKRGVDDWGNGAFQASRGSRKHKGIDFACFPGTRIFANLAGKVTKLGYPYGDDLSYRYVEVTDTGQYRHRYFYVQPGVNLGEYIERAAFIGEAQDISSRYSNPQKDSMKNHVHYEILDSSGTPIDPEVFHGLVQKSG